MAISGDGSHESLFILKAADQSSQPISQVADAIKRLVVTLKEQIALSEQGKGRNDELKKSYRDLADAANLIVQQKDAIDKVVKARLEEAKALDMVAKRQENLKRVTAANTPAEGSRDPRQQNRIDVATRQLDSAQGRLEKYQRTLMQAETLIGQMELENEARIAKQNLLLERRVALVEQVAEKERKLGAVTAWNTPDEGAAPSRQQKGAITRAQNEFGRAQASLAALDAQMAEATSATAQMTRDDEALAAVHAVLSERLRATAEQLTAGRIADQNALGDKKRAAEASAALAVQLQKEAEAVARLAATKAAERAEEDKRRESGEAVRRYDNRDARAARAEQIEASGIGLEGADLARFQQRQGEAEQRAYDQRVQKLDRLAKKQQELDDAYTDAGLKHIHELADAENEAWEEALHKRAHAENVQFNEALDHIHALAEAEDQRLGIIAQNARDREAISRLSQEARYQHENRDEVAQRRSDAREAFDPAYAARMQRERDQEVEQRRDALSSLRDEATGASARAQVVDQRIAAIRSPAPIIQGPAATGVASAFGAFKRPDTGGIDEALDHVEKSLRRHGLAAHVYVENLETMFRVQEKVARQAELIDAFNAQTEAVRKAEEAYAAAAERVRLVVAEIAKGGDDVERLAAELRSAEGALRGGPGAPLTGGNAAANLEREIKARDRITAQLQREKIDTTALDVETKKLAMSAERVVRLQNEQGTKGSGKVFGMDPFVWRNVEYRLDDVITQLSMGQGLLFTFESQAGKTLKIFDLSIFQLKLLFLYFLPAAAAIAVVGLALDRVLEKEAAMRRFNGMVEASADGFRTTGQELESLAGSVEKFGTTMKEADDAIGYLFHEGIDPTRMRELAHAAKEVSDIYGTPFQEALKEVTSAMKGGYEAVVKLDDKYNFLTASRRADIRAMIEGGHAQEALNLVLEDFLAKNANSEKSLSPVELGIRKLIEAWKSYMDTLGNSGPLQAIIRFFERWLTLANSIARLLSGDLSRSNFIDSVNRLVSGKPQASEVENRVDSLQTERDKLASKTGTYEKGLPSYEESKERIRRQNPNANLTDDVASRGLLGMTKQEYDQAKQRILDIEKEIAGLKSQTELGSLVSERDELMKNRDRAALNSEGTSGTTQSKPGVPESYGKLRDQAADLVGVNREVAASLNRAEGVWNSRTQSWQDSSSGAKGGFQLLPSTFDDVKKAHPDLVKGQITDDFSNAVAGLLYFKEQLIKFKGDVEQAAKATWKYHDGPNAKNVSPDAEKEMSNVVRGIPAGIDPLQPTGTLSEKDMRIAQINERIRSLPLDTRQEYEKATPGSQVVNPDEVTSSAANKPAFVAQTSEEIAKVSEDYARVIRDETDHMRDRLARGPEAQKIQDERVEEERRKLVAGAESKGIHLPEFDQRTKEWNPEQYLKLSAPVRQVADEITRRLAKLFDELDKRRKQNDDRDAREERTREVSLTKLIRDTAEKASKKDPTDLDAQRQVVLDEYAAAREQIDKMEQEGTKTDSKGRPLDEIRKTLDELEKLALAGANVTAYVARLDEIIKQRKQALDRINDDLANEKITPVQANAARLAVVNSFAPQVAAAGADVNRSLDEKYALQPGEAPSMRDAEIRDKTAGYLSDTPAQVSLKDQIAGAFKQAEAALASVKETKETQKTLQSEGLTTPDQTRSAVAQAYTDAGPSFGEAKDSIEGLLKQLQDANAPTSFIDNLRSKLKLMEADFRNVSDQDKELMRGIESSIGGRAVQAFDSVGRSVGNLIAGQERFKDLLTDVGTAFSNFASGVLQDIAKIIIQQQIMNALNDAFGSSGGLPNGGLPSPAGGGGIGGLLGKLLGSAGSLFGGGGGADAIAADGVGIGSAAAGGAAAGGGFLSFLAPLFALLHGGGTVGSSTMSRTVDPSVFQFAQRYHSGGTVGLAHDEVPAILQRGEEVLSKADAKRFAASQVGQQSAGMGSIRNILAVGDKEIAGAMNSSHGEKVVLNILQRNAPSIKQMIG